MKVIAVVTADFERGALGTRSRLADDLGGGTVVRRTLERVLKCERVASVHLVVDTAQAAAGQAAVEGLAVKLETHHAGDVPWFNYVRSARKWSLDAWRGGLGSTCVFDESLHPWLLEALGRREQADGVVDVPAAAVLLDPRLLDAMIGHYETTADDVRMTFTQSAPGLSAAIYSTPLLGDLVKACHSAGRMMAYNPAQPRRDMIMLPCFYPPETDVRRAFGRCVADTDAAVDRIAACLRECRVAGGDDVRVVLGGFGDPLLHPEWPGYVRRCREAGIFAVAVRTPAVTLDKAAIDVLEENQVDVLNVLLDAATPETYRDLHQADHYDRVLANLDALLASHQARQQPQPLLACEMIKARATMDEIEPFYDKWIGKVGSAVIVGPSDYAGQFVDRAVMDMAPPTRFACERLFTRALVLADGRVTVCDQDYRGRHAVGSLADSSLAALWTGETLTATRRSHQAGTYDAMPLCRSCREWHRP